MSTNPVVLNTPTMTDELKQAISAAINPETLRAAIIAEAEKQAETQQVAAAKAETERQAVATEPQVFTQTEVIGGKELLFTAASELELERQINNAYRVAYAIQTPEIVEEVVDPAIAKQQEEQQAAAKAELDLKFKRGEISAKDYIEQSGALDEYLASRGIPVDELKNSVEQNQNKRFEQSWADATQEFLQSQGGSDWPGGERNLQLIGLQLQSMGLVETEDKVGALVQAYQALKSTGMLFKEEGSTQPAQQPQQTQQTPQTQQTVVQPTIQTQQQPRTQSSPGAASSSLFGASSGVGAFTATVPTTGAKIDVPADATPQQILDAWNKSQVAQGRDPNAAFVETFSRK